MGSQSVCYVLLECEFIMEWSTQPPTKTGVYWVLNKDRKRPNLASVFSVGHTEDLLVRYLYGDSSLADEMDGAMAKYQFWYGPLEFPAMPEIKDFLVVRQ